MNVKIFAWITYVLNVFMAQIVPSTNQFAPAMCAWRVIMTLNAPTLDQYAFKRKGVLNAILCQIVQATNMLA